MPSKCISICIFCCVSICTLGWGILLPRCWRVGDSWSTTPPNHKATRAPPYVGGARLWLTCVAAYLPLLLLLLLRSRVADQLPRAGGAHEQQQGGGAPADEQCGVLPVWGGLHAAGNVAALLARWGLCAGAVVQSIQSGPVNPVQSGLVCSGSYMIIDGLSLVSGHSEWISLRSVSRIALWLIGLGETSSEKGNHIAATFCSCHF